MTPKNSEVDRGEHAKATSSTMLPASASESVISSRAIPSTMEE
jgi:hypothetical protein